MLQFKKILVAKDFSKCSEQALLYSLSLAKYVQASEVHIVFVAAMRDSEAYNKKNIEIHDTAIKQQLQALNTADKPDGNLQIRRAVVHRKAIVPGLLQYIEDHDIDLVVMGTHGRNRMRNWLLGSVAQAFMQETEHPVIVVRQQDTAPVFRPSQGIVIPIDFSKQARHALEIAKNLAFQSSSVLHLLHVDEVSTPDTTSPLSTKQLETFFEETRGEHCEATFHMQEGAVVPQITSFVEKENPTLAILATHFLADASNAPLGSIATALVSKVHTPLMILPDSPFVTTLRHEAQQNLEEQISFYLKDWL